MITIALQPGHWVPGKKRRQLIIIDIHFTRWRDPKVIAVLRDVKINISLPTTRERTNSGLLTEGKKIDPSQEDPGRRNIFLPFNARSRKDRVRKHLTKF